MVAKVGQARREAFLAGLRETGNQTIAAERAKVSRSWVQLHRAGDPAFRRATDAALAEARTSFDRLTTSEGSMKPPSEWRFFEGEELVVRGTGGSGGGKPRQIARSRLRQWSPRAEERFLSALTATCNVKAACAEVGLTPASAYNHRRRWAGFARRWDEAVEIGYWQIEAGLIAAACNLFSEEGMPDVQPLRGMTVEDAKQVLYMHRHRVHGIGGRPGRRPRPSDIEDIRAEILHKVEVLERARKAPGKA